MNKTKRNNSHLRTSLLYKKRYIHHMPLCSTVHSALLINNQAITYKTDYKKTDDFTSIEANRSYRFVGQRFFLCWAAKSLPLGSKKSSVGQQKVLCWAADLPPLGSRFSGAGLSIYIPAFLLPLMPSLRSVLRRVKASSFILNN